MSAKKILPFLLLPLLILGIFTLFLPAAFATDKEILLAQAAPLPADEPATTEETDTVKSSVPGNFGLDETLEVKDKKTGVSPKDALIDKTPTSIIGTVVSTVLSLVGVVFFLLILYGGLRWMIAQGNESEVEKAKQILIAATIGLIIVLAAYAITTFIGNNLIKATG